MRFPDRRYLLDPMFGRQKGLFVAAPGSPAGDCRRLPKRTVSIIMRRELRFIIETNLAGW
jgi:hypothetical protein